MSTQTGATVVAEKGGRNDREVAVKVFAPRSPDPKKFSWDKTMKVGDAAREAATAFGYAATDKVGLRTRTTPSRTLDNNKPLVAEHIEDGDELELIATGGGV